MEALIIAGPTASGKTELALAAAAALNGEILSADSRQIYRDLDAGTAKPRRDAQGRVGGIPYHLVDIVDPREPFDAGRFAAEARRLARDIRARGKLPIVAGGTGLYLRAFLFGLSEMPGKDDAVRAELLETARRHGREALHQELSRIDPEAARRIPANNIQRVSRALEVHRLTGRPISSFWSPAPTAPAPGCAAVVIQWDAAELRRRIIARAETMWPALLQEAEKLRAKYRGDEPGFQSLGYQEAWQCAAGRLSSKEGLAGMIQATCAYAKRQRTWFAHQLAASPVAGGSAASMLEETLKIALQHET